MRRGGPIARISQERGSVLVLFAIVLPIILLFASLVIDVANWFEHKRHLQMQADAAALAGGSRVAIPCDSAAVQAEILKYAGIGGSEYNAQVGGTPSERLHMAVNSRTWPLQSSPIDETVAEGDPCETGMVDVKLTENDVPWFFGIAPLLGIDAPEFIDARARASIVKVGTLGGALPIGVPDVDPLKGEVQFIDEDTDAVLGKSEIERIGEFNGFAKWSTKSPISMTVGSGNKNIGLRVVLSGGNSLECGMPLVDCYDLQSSDGLLYLRGIPDAAGGGDPVLKAVGLRATDLQNCPDAYFTYSSVSCPTGLSADVDFGSADPVAELGAKVTAVASGKSYAAVYSGGSWTLPAQKLIPIESGKGPVPIELQWEQTKGTRNGEECGNGGNNPCKGTFGTVQRAFAGSDGRSGPIRSAQIYESGLPLTDHSLAEGDHTLTVDIGLLGRLSDATTIDAPLVALRVGTDSGSNGQSLDCDTELNTLVEEIAQGCGETYTVNQGTPCPTSGQELWSSWDQPWPCVRSQTGGPVTGQVGKGMNLRILGSEKPTSCTSPNLWEDSFNNGFHGDDPRIVQVFVTPYGAFSAQGDTTVPVTNFATFYVTGWVGNPGFDNPCLDEGDQVIGAGEQGFIYGHFIKYIQTLPSGGGTEQCDFDSFGACTMVLTE